MPYKYPMSSGAAMKKIRLEITGLSYSQLQSGAYALVLNEKNGKRKLPIIIGSFEAQSIAMELEKIRPGRPLTHDLIVSFAKSFEIELVEIIIDKFVEGVFHAKLICLQNNKMVEIDSRTSDAVSLAVRFKCPIYTYEKILSETGVVIDPDEDNAEADKAAKEAKKKADPSEKEQLSLEKLHELMNKAIENENYEKASEIRDEIQRRTKK